MPPASTTGPSRSAAFGPCQSLGALMFCLHGTSTIVSNIPDVATQSQPAREQARLSLPSVARRLCGALQVSLTGRRNVVHVNHLIRHSPDSRWLWDQNRPFGRVEPTMIEAAWLWLRHQPGSALSRWFQERVRADRGRLRRVSMHFQTSRSPVPSSCRRFARHLEPVRRMPPTDDGWRSGDRDPPARAP
jgi:hypothetical protein